MTRLSTVLPAAVSLLLGMISLTSTCHADSPRPNILYLYVDDMGWGSIGPNAQWQRQAEGLPYVRTPNLDAIAKGGLNFTRGYGCHVCSPARSSQQTGFHQGHTFADRNDPNNAKKAMRVDDICMGEALSKAGYATGYWGKWGYGGSKDLNNPTIDNLQTLPTSHGYQHVLAELHHVRAHTFFQPTLWKAPAPAGSTGGLHLVANSMKPYQNGDAYPSTPALQNHAEYPTTAYCDDAYAFAALDFIRSQGQTYNQTGTPFFGLLAVQIPHAPFGEIESLPEWDQHYVNDPQFDELADQTRQWAAMVTRIDAHFGNLMAALEDPNNDGNKEDSIADNTLVIFQSDNGGPGGKNREELNANGGLQGVKGKIQEGGIRVPLLMRWPAKINASSNLKPGTSTDRLVDVTDLLPTFCELAGVKPPAGVDGVSIAPTLTGKGHQRQRQFLIHEAGNGQSIIEGRWKLIRSSKAKYSLYDLVEDHSESNDLAAKHPRRVTRMQKLLLGERVDEPRGFANTYHHWTGDDHAVTSDADHWSDYEYANAGVTYMTDAGAPQASWVAHLVNQSDRSKTAVADSDLEVLALTLAGGTTADSKQTLQVPNEVQLSGRNEIRVGSGGHLAIDGGSVSSLRWIDVDTGGTLEGTGNVSGLVFNHGMVQSTGELKITGSYHQSPEGTLSITAPPSTDQPALQVSGGATIKGELQLDLKDASDLKKGDTIPVLSAKKITGKFNNPGDQVTTNDGTTLKLQYSESTVSAVVTMVAGRG